MVSIARVENVSFNPVEQRIEAGLTDHRGKVANMVLPFHARGADGFNRFLKELESNGHAAKFISGHVTMANQQLTIRPLAVVIEFDGSRYAIYPYWSLENDEKRVNNQAVDDPSDDDVTFRALGETTSPLKQFFDRLCQFNAEILLLGIENGADAIERLSAELVEVATAIGFLQIAALIERLQNELIRRKNDIHSDNKTVVQLSQQLSLIGRIEAM